MSKEPYIYYCADDYGMTEESCRRIEDCRRNGCLNKVSVFPNSELPDLKQRLTALGLSCSIHLNLVEGKALSEPSEIPLLADAEGRFRHSFFGLLCLSLTKPRQLKDQIYRELDRQLRRAQTFLPDGAPIMLDTHQHTGMIPGIFSTLLKLVRDRNLDVRYIRIPAEPLMPFITAPSAYMTYTPVNLIKQWVLKCCNLFNKRKLRASGIPTAYFFGIVLSGDMETKVVQKILPKYIKLARKKEMNIEVLFHPGFIEQGEPLFDPHKTSFHGFYLSQGRKKEYDALHRLGTGIPNR